MDKPKNLTEFAEMLNADIRLARESGDAELAVELRATQLFMRVVAGLTGELERMGIKTTPEPNLDEANLPA